MMQLFLLQNGLLTTNIKREIDVYVPLKVDLNYSKTLSQASKFISFDSEDNSLEMNIGIPYGEIYGISCINRKSIIINSPLNKSNLINKRLSAPLIITDALNEESYHTINKKIWFYYYSDCLLLSLNQNLKTAYYNFIINESLSILTDNNHQILAFLFNQLTKTEKLKLTKFIDFSKIKSINAVDIHIGGTMNLLPQKNTINAILDLKNINVWEFLYDGLRKKIIDNDFIVYFAEQYLESGHTSEFAIIIAGLLKDEHNKIPELFADKYKTPPTNIKLLYNDTWFYISSLQNSYDNQVL